MSIITDWTEQDRKDYGKVIQAKTHRLADSGLFTDEALAALLDRHPTDKIDVCTMTDDPLFPAKHCTVDFRGFSGAELIEAAKAGRVWINVREAMSYDAAYIPLMEDTYADLERCTGRDRLRRNCRGGILISSPTAKVPYHCDPTMTLLWHIRGKKRVFVYPPTEEFLPDTAYEAVVLGEKDQDIPYSPAFEDAAMVYDLPENTLVAWPHTSPHRVENQSFCISMVMEFTSKTSAYRNSVMYTNGLLRRHFGMNPSWHRSGPIERGIKSVTGHVLRKLGAHKVHVREDYVHYALDKAAPNFLRPINKTLRNF
ncbi:hypothetical protein [Fretibacter rubidus]|uniref:hypothetical protein n=1 Tax=Fretibacter rubidus TaxID=570162 RepID=UPI00352B36B3